MHLELQLGSGPQVRRQCSLEFPANHQLGVRISTQQRPADTALPAAEDTDRYIINEVPSDSDLSADVSELGKSGVKETVLLVERLDCGVCICLFRLELQISVRDLRNGRADRRQCMCSKKCSPVHYSQEEHNRQEDAETCDGEINPLHISQSLFTLAHVDKDNV